MNQSSSLCIRLCDYASLSGQALIFLTIFLYICGFASYTHTHGGGEGCKADLCPRPSASDEGPPQSQQRNLIFSNYFILYNLGIVWGSLGNVFKHLGNNILLVINKFYHASSQQTATSYPISVELWNWKWACAGVTYACVVMRNARKIYNYVFKKLLDIIRYKPDNEIYIFIVYI